MRTTTLARLESKVRPLLTGLPSKTVVSIYSKGRRDFLERFEGDIPDQSYVPSKILSRRLWGLEFRSPIMNAAGMFKNGEGYCVVEKQGAGAYLGGTGTWNPRRGNEKNGIYLPFVPYPISHSSSNWLGLPNEGDEENVFVTLNLANQRNRIPIGWSVRGSPDLEGEEKLDYLVKGMKKYDYAGVDFLEMNESCPNTQHGRPQDSDLANRLRYVKENFLDQRRGRLPVVVKFSNDTEIEQLPALLDLLFELGFAGVNFGNTSTNYEAMRQRIHPSERRLFDYFTKTFGGGVSGRPLKEKSLELAARAVDYLRRGPPAQEFHVIRTGGIETFKDILDSERAGISLNQWFTGYFEGFAQYGNDVYRVLFEG